MNDYKLNTKYKDRLFRLIFNDRQKLLELYNAVNESNYTNPDELNLYEHQSTFSPNLPLRGVFYFSSVYKAYIEPVKHKLYSTSELKIPFPQYIVFYNGIEEKPERQEFQVPQNETLLKIKNAFSLEDEDAQHYIDEYWK